MAGAVGKRLPRAGEAGAGFAVVAEEVRTLAQRSAEAAHEADRLIDESRTTASGGADQVALVVQSISGFADDLARMKQLVDAISQASDEQARGIRHAGEGVDRIERLVHSTTATSEEIAASSEELAGQAQTANDLVDDLRQNDRRDGGAPGGGRAGPPDLVLT